MRFFRPSTFDLRRVVRGVATLVAAAAACSPGTDHERLGDRRYAERAFTDALAEYRLALKQRRPSYELRAKFASAALHVGALEEAAGAYREMALAEPVSVDEAADGLVRVARVAIDTRDMAALSKTIAVLHEVAPERPVGRLAVALGVAYEPSGRPADALDVLLQAAATAAHAATSDSLLVLYADLNARIGQCDPAARVYEAVLRRSRSPRATGSARRGLAGCSVERGRQALGAGFLQEAEEWFRRAVALAEPDSVVRVAWLLIGDARWANGDTAVAVEAYRKALEGAEESDAVAARANEQLRKLLGAGNPDR